MKYYGAVEGGGTKFVCSIATGPDDYLEELRFPTTTPTETLGQVIEYFTARKAKYNLQAIGFGSFGPVDLDVKSPSYGYITTTPKPLWAYTDVVGTLHTALNLPIAFDTDVNVAAIAEYKWGNPERVKSLVYTTIGTGIGSGLVLNGKIVHGLVHPETGHLFITQDKERDPFEGNCIYHANRCFEGLCAGPAIQRRFGVPGELLPANHPFWEVFAGYIAQALVNIIVTVSPQKLVLGGGVAQQLHLFPLIHQNVRNMLNGYVQHPSILEHIDTYITPPALGNRSGACGAIAIAQEIQSSVLRVQCLELKVES